MYELYTNDTINIIILCEDQHFIAFIVNPISSNIERLLEATNKNEILQSIKAFFNPYEPLTPTLQFDGIVGFVGGSDSSYLITCNLASIAYCLGHTIYRPTNIRFSQLKMQPIATLLVNQQLLQTESEHINALLDGGPCVNKGQEPDQAYAQQELVNNLRAFFQENQQYLFCSPLNLTRIETTEENFAYYANALLIPHLQKIGIEPLHIILGDVSQVNSDLQQAPLLITIITRQNQLHVGTRFNARGLNSLGGAANEYEHEIVYEYRGFFQCQTILRGSVPLHWKSDANLIKNDFLLDDQCETMSATYWKRSLKQYESCCIVNLLKQQIQRTVFVLESPKKKQAEDLTDETVICTAFAQSIINVNKSLEEQNKKLVYNNFSWHEEVAEVKSKASQWFKNDGLIQSGNLDIFNIGSEQLNNTTLNSSVLSLRQEPMYIYQMLTFAKLLYVISEYQFDCSFGSFDQTQINTVYKQKRLLRINCADSLDRTNLVLFHIVQFFNAININFIADNYREILKQLKTENSIANEVSSSSSLFSVEKQKTIRNAGKFNVYESHLQAQSKIFQQFSHMKENIDNRIIFLQILEQLLFTGQQGIIYPSFAQIFFKIANQLSIIYTGVDAAHQEILKLFADIEVQPNSIVAIKRRLVSVSTKEQKKHESKISLQMDQLYSYLSIRPLSFLMEQCPPQYINQLNKTWLQSLYDIYCQNFTDINGASDNQIAYLLLKQQSLNESIMYIRHHQIDLKFQELIKLKSFSQLASTILALKTIQQYQQLKNIDFKYFQENNFSSINVDLLLNRMYNLEDNQGEADFKTSPFLRENLVNSLMYKQNILNFVRCEEITNENTRIDEVMKFQIQSDFCQIQLLDTLGLIRNLPMYCAEQISNEPNQVLQVLNLVQQSSSKNCYVLNYEFTTLISITDAVLIVPTIQVGICSTLLTMLAVDENNVEFLMYQVNIPATNSSQQQIHLPMPKYCAQSQSALQQTIFSLQMLLDKPQLQCTSQYPRCKKLSLIFQIQKETTCLPKVCLFGVERFTKQIIKKEFVQFNNSVSMLTSTLLSEKVQKLQRNNITYPLLALCNYYKYTQKDEFKIVDAMFTQVFQMERSEALKEIFNDYFVIYCFCLKLQIPMHYVYSTLKLLNVSNVTMMKTVQPVIQFADSNQIIVPCMSILNSFEKIYCQKIDEVLQNNDFIKEISSNAVLCRNCAKKDKTLTCAVCQQGFCKNCVYETILPITRMFDFSKGFVVCKTCATTEQKIQKILGEYLTFQIDYCKLAVYEQQNYQITDQQVQILVEGQCSNVNIQISKRIQVQEVSINQQKTEQYYQTEHKYFIQYQFNLTNKCLILLKCNKAISKKDIQIQIESRHNQIPYINFAALQQPQQHIQYKQIEPFDQLQTRSQQTSNKILFDYVFVEKMTVQQVRFDNQFVKPVTIKLFYLSPYEEDDYIHLKKKPTKWVKAKQNINCGKVTQEQISVCQNYIGGNQIGYCFQNQYQSNRVQVEVCFEELAADIRMELWGQ